MTIESSSKSTAAATSNPASSNPSDSPPAPQKRSTMRGFGFNEITNLTVFVKNRIIAEFQKMGYTVNSKILMASEYGVPQDRKRIFFLGFSDGFIKFPAPTHAKINVKQRTIGGVRPVVTVREAISDLPLLIDEQGYEGMPYSGPPKNDYQRKMRERSIKIYNHVATMHDEKTKRIISLVQQGKNYKSLPEEFRHSRNFHVAWTRIHYDRPSPTIDTGHRHHFHPEANRVPTVRESARIQSIPDKFIFYGSKTSQYRQVGNAVPSLLAYHVAKEIKEVI